MDPLAELYLGFNPYAYVGNNPILFNDPNGMFRTRFGAWIEKLFNGGDEIRKDKENGEWYVGTEVRKSDAIVYKKTFRSNGSRPSGGLTNAIDHLPSNLSYASMKFLEQHEVVGTAGDAIVGVGVLVAPYAPPVGTEIVVFGEGVGTAGFIMSGLHTAFTSKKVLRELFKKSAVVLLPTGTSKSLKTAIQKLNISKDEKQILESILAGHVIGLEKGLEKPIHDIVDEIFDKLEK